MFERERVEAVQDALSARVEQGRTWARENPGKCLALGVGLLLLGAAVIYFSIREKKTLPGLFGMLAAVGGLKAISVRIGLETERHPWRWLALVVFGTAVGCLTVIVAFSRDSAPVMALGVLALVLCLLPVADLFRRLSEPSPGGGAPADRSGPWWLVPVGLVVIALGVVAGRWHWAAMAVALFGGLIVYKLGLRRAGRSAAWAVREAWLGGFASALGAAGMVVASWGRGRFLGNDAMLGALAAGLFVLGLMALSAGWPSESVRLRPFGKWAAISSGAVAVAAGALVAKSTLNLTVEAAIVFGVVVGALGASFVWSGEALFLAVLVGSALVWVTVDRDDPPPVFQPPPDQRILALGDSYISGEGAPHFIEGTNVKDENQCRRSVTAYPYLVAKDLGMGLDFFACSGAKASELHADKQQPKSPADVVGGRPQLDNPMDVKKIKVVLVSIGGNDAQFGDIVQGCVIPGTCDALRDLWLTNLDQIGARITVALSKIKEKVVDVPIVVMPYPLMLEDHTCDWSRLDQREHQFISEFVVLLNDRVRVAAARAGVHFFADGMFAFEGARICGGKPDETVTNFVNINPVQGSFVQKINARDWIHGSFHPKPSGHQLIAKKLTPWLKDLLAGIKDPAKANPPPEPAAAFAYRNTGGTTPVLVSEADRVVNPPCQASGKMVEPFGTRVRLYEEDLPFPVIAATNSWFCIRSEPAGPWISLLPSADQNVDAYVEDGVVYVKPPKVDRPVEQRVVFTGTDGRVQLRVVTFCVTSDCPDSFDHYFNDQIGLATGVVVPPLLLTIIGGWFVAAGTKQRRPPAHAPD